MALRGTCRGGAENAESRSERANKERRDKPAATWKVWIRRRSGAASLQWRSAETGIL